MAVNPNKRRKRNHYIDGLGIARPAVNSPKLYFEFSERVGVYTVWFNHAMLGQIKIAQFKMEHNWFGQCCKYVCHVIDPRLCARCNAEISIKQRELNNALLFS